MNPTLTQIIAYINQYITTNGINSITGAENNQALTYLANAILNYSVNGSLAGISSSTGVVPLSKPITLFSVAPTSINWPDNFQFEYYIINATGVNIPITAGYSYVDQYGVSQTVILARTSIHIVKATNGQWVQANNLGEGEQGIYLLKQDMLASLCLVLVHPLFGQTGYTRYMLVMPIGLMLRRG